MGSLAAQGLSLPIALLCFTFFHPVKLELVHLDELMFKKNYIVIKYSPGIWNGK